MSLLFVIDGDGLSEIPALFILADELKSTVESIVKIFQKRNEFWTETEVIMSDKDIVEREAFSKCFANSSLLICLYHTLKMFRRELTCEKMGVKSMCSKYASLMQFFFEFFTFLGAIRNYHHLKTLSRKEIALICAAKKDEVECLEQLTPYALKIHVHSTTLYQKRII